MARTCRYSSQQRWGLIENLKERRGETFVSICARHRVRRSTGYRWWRRYLSKGEIHEQSRRPKSFGNSHADRVRSEVLRLATRYRVGAGMLQWYLRREHRTWRLPSERSIHRWLVEAGKVKRQRWKAPAGPVIAPSHNAQASRCNQIWGIDFKGSFRTGDGTLVHALTITDVYSRYVLAVQTVRALSVREVRKRMQAVFKRYGLPNRIRVDHGAPFFGPGARGWTQLSVWWVRLGIEVVYIKLNGNASHEQMHRMLKDRTAKPPARTICGQRARFASWRRFYNEGRPHSGADKNPPALRYACSPRAYPARLPPLMYPPQYYTTRVNKYGCIYWRNRKRSIGAGFAGQLIGLEPVGPKQNVYLGKHLLGTLRPAEPWLRPARTRRGG